MGQAIPIDDQGFTVIGIAPAHHPARIDGAAVWIPYTAQPLLDPGRDMFRSRSAELILDGRLAAGVSRGAAQAEWNVIVGQVNRLHPGRQTSVTLTDGSAISMIDSGTSRFYVLFVLAMSAPWIVLLITCANVTTLLLSRAVARRREIAVRLSLGAPRTRLLRMLLMESCLLAGVAGSAALYLAYRVPGPLFRFLTGDPPDFPMSPDWRIFLFLFGVVAATGCLAGMAPAFESLKVDLTASLKGHGSTAGTLAARFPVRSFLVSAQVAMGLTLLVCAGQVGSVELQTHGGDPGFDAGRVLEVPLRFPARSSPGSSLALYRNLEARIRSLPGVQSVTYADSLPFLGDSQRIPRPDGETDASVLVNAASPGYLETLGIPIVQGRDFRGADGPSPSEPLHAIVSQSFARTFLPNRYPVGQRFQGGPTFSIDIIGVAKDVKAGAGDPLAAYLLPAWNSRRTILLIRFAGDPRGMADAVRATVRGAYPDFVVTPRTLQTAFDESHLLEWRLALVLLALAGVAVLLAVAGTYGVVAFSVSQRTRELGIRAALGARPADIIREVLRSGVKPVLHGLFIGVWLSLLVETAVKQTFSKAPIQFDAANPAVYLAAALLLGVAAVVAMWAPARRGAGADPLEALHYD